MASASAVNDLAKDGGIGGVIALDDKGSGEFFLWLVLQVVVKYFYFSRNAVELPWDVPRHDRRGWCLKNGHF